MKNDQTNRRTWPNNLSAWQSSEQFEAWFTEATSNSLIQFQFMLATKAGQIVLEGYYAYLHPVKGTRPNPKIHGIIIMVLPAGPAIGWIIGPIQTRTPTGS